MRIPLILTLGLMPLGQGAAARAQALPQDPEATLVVATPGYRFHVDFWHNLHDYMYWRAQEDGPGTEGAGCVSARPEAERADWRDAEEYYRRALADRHWRRDPVMRAVRYTLSGLATDSPASTVPLFERMRAAAPVYRACFWERHHELARARVADVLPHLITLGPALQRRLEVYYESEWPRGVHVDVLPYASPAGANTASGPDVPPHMQISSIDASLAGLSGLELLLHEASHEIFGVGRGLVGETIDRVSTALGVRPPRDLWHAVSFFTTGYVMEQIAAESGLEYVAYWDRTGLFRRAWPEYLEPVRVHWTRYLRGEVEAESALSSVVGDIGR